MALDLSYIIPIFLRRLCANHPEVMFKPGPFFMGNGWLGWAVNVTCILWTLFICVIFSLPVARPVTAVDMNYASVSGLVNLLSNPIHLTKMCVAGDHHRSYPLGVVSDFSLFRWLSRLTRD